MSTRCPVCATLIEEWAHGTCPRCARDEEKNTRHGRLPLNPHDARMRKGVVPVKPIPARNARPTPFPQNRPLDERETRRDAWDTYGRQHLNGINCLLKDIYGSQVLISDLLREQGYDEVWIAKHGRSTTWLLRFLERFRQELLIELTTHFGYHPAHALYYRYIVGWSTETIARECRMPASQVDRVIENIVQYLGSPDGQKQFTRVIKSSVAS